MLQAPKANQPHSTCKIHELLHEPGSIQGKTAWNIIQMAYKRKELGWKFRPKQVWLQLHVILVNVKTFWWLLHTAIQTHGWCFPVIWSICALLEVVSSWKPVASICLSGTSLLDLHSLWQLSTKLFLFNAFPPFDKFSSPPRALTTHDHEIWKHSWGSRPRFSWCWTLLQGSQVATNPKLWKNVEHRTFFVLFGSCELAIFWT